MKQLTKLPSVQWKCAVCGSAAGCACVGTPSERLHREAIAVLQELYATAVDNGIPDADEIISSAAANFIQGCRT